MGDSGGDVYRTVKRAINVTGVKTFRPGNPFPSLEILSLANELPLGEGKEVKSPLGS